MLRPSRDGRNRAGKLNPHIFWAALGRKSKIAWVDLFAKVLLIHFTLLAHFTKGENVHIMSIYELCLP